MKSPLLILIAAAAMALAAHAAGAAPATDEGTDSEDDVVVDQPCMVINGKPGLDNQGPNSGNGGKGATIDP
jgi:hypothetical protein